MENGLAAHRTHEGDVRYTLTGVSFLLRVPPTTLRRWAAGYTDQLTYSKVERPGALGPEVDADGLFTFPAMIELLFVRELLRPKVIPATAATDKRSVKRRLSDICKMAENLREKIGPYPFARANLKENGLDVVSDQLHPDNLFTSAIDGQYLLVIADELVTSLEFDSDGLANLWYPDQDNKLVFLNPHMRFGCPMVPSGVSTEAIVDRYRVEGNIPDTSEWFGVPSDEVEAAIKFEEAWRSKIRVA